eukprot:TRINITY_DN2865_c0_g1_i1.p2 TRINITY_DN2865_c0_g1~~TRINITY_DN2865_c0_g1_i1.p2  ORF type:complete len:154 (+),score=36.47 TRINITY_DN2865_c0_g1_i1:41-463(+)
MDEITNTSRFRPDKEFDGIDKSKKAEPRTGPVQFEKTREESDPYGLDKFLHEAKNSKKESNTRQKLGVMHATGGSSGPAEEYRGKRKRDRVDFESGRAGSDDDRRDRDRDRERERERERDKHRARDNDRHKERNRRHRRD